MKNTPSNVRILEEMLKPCKSGCGCKESLELAIVSDVIISAAAYCDKHVRKPGDFFRGNYFRWLYTSGRLAAAIG